MRSNITDITVHRGESFTLQYLLQNRDGTPYIISDALDNPYFLLTVVSSAYFQQNRYEECYWLSLTDFPKFTLTRPMKIQDLTNMEVSSFDDLLIINNEKYGYGFNAGINGEWQFIPRTYAVFYDENKPDEYMYIADNGRWTSYKCRIIKTFTSDDTSKWTSKTYKYSVRLVTGESTREHLKSLADLHNIDFTVDDVNYSKSEISTEDLYNKLAEKNVIVKDEIDITKPILNIYASYPILRLSDINVI